MSHNAYTYLFDKPAYIDAVANIGGTIDDRKYFVRSSLCLTIVCHNSFTFSQLEKVLTLMAKLGNDVEFSQRLQQVVINIREHIPLHLAPFSSHHTTVSFSVQGLASPPFFVSCPSSSKPSRR
jgi:hypothetical protein